MYEVLKIFINLLSKNGSFPPLIEARLIQSAKSHRQYVVNLVSIQRLQD
jgi:hypothetical protein